MLPTVVSRSDGIEQSAEARRASLKRSPTPIDTRDPEPISAERGELRIALTSEGTRGHIETADVLADAITATLDNELVAERAQLLGRRLRNNAGADPTVAFLANGSASGGFGRTRLNP